MILQIFRCLFLIASDIKCKKSESPTLSVVFSARANKRYKIDPKIQIARIRPPSPTMIVVVTSNLKLRTESTNS